MSVCVENFSNGTILVGQPSPELATVAINILTPFGSVNEIDDQIGISNIATDLVSLAGGDLDPKNFASAVDRIGMRKSFSAGTEASVYSAVMLSDYFFQGLDLIESTFSKAKLYDEQLEGIKLRVIQEILSIEDEPSSQVMEELSKKFYPEPFGRSILGSKNTVNNLQLSQINEYLNHQLNKPYIISVAGNFDWDKLKERIQSSFFASLKGSFDRLSFKGFSNEINRFHTSKDTNQQQIALAYPFASANDEDYFACRLLINILSGGMSGRLFVEVREKRGLVYSVSASHSSAKDRGAVFVYAGTTPKNARECLSVILNELNRLEEGFSEEEISRAKVDLKSRLVISSESTTSRASIGASDFWTFGRVRPVEEIKSAIDKISNNDLINVAKKYKPTSYTLMSIGQEDLSS